MSSGSKSSFLIMAFLLGKSVSQFFGFFYLLMGIKGAYEGGISSLLGLLL
jgi:hypothetical protein